MLRRGLILLALAAFLPLIALAAGLAILAFVQQRTAMRDNAVEHAVHLLDHIERELRGHVDLLNALAQSPTLDGDAPDLRAFHEVASRFKMSNPDWDRVILLRDRRQVVNTFVPFGTELPAVHETESYDRVLATKAPAISNLSGQGRFSPTTLQVGVRVPVLGPNGEVRFILTALVTTERLAKLTASSGLPAGWRPFLIDANDRVVAAPASPDTVGSRAGERAVAARAGGTGGVYDGYTNTGSPVVTAFTKSERTGWSAHVSIPLAIFNAPRDRVLFLLSTAGAVALGLTALFVGLLRREIVAHRQDALLRERGTRMEALGRMTGGVAHDFNNLLMVILGSVEMLQRRVQAPGVERYATAIRKAAERGSQLTRELLAFSRGDAKRAEVLDLGERVRTATAMLRQSLHASIRIEVSIPPGSHPVRVDPIQLDLAILNIAVNARDAMADGGQLTISIRRGVIPDRSGQAAVVLAITDTGGGVPPEALPHVFEPFFTTKEVGKGTGLGLSQVYGFAKAAGGIADIASKVGQGTTVTIYLPEAEGVVVTPEVTSPVMAETHGRGRILLVDDDDPVRSVTADYLAHAGYEVYSVPSAAAALAALERGGADVLVSDVVMPGELDGIALAREARLRWPNLPILLVSGYTASTDAAAALGLDVLGKPFEMSELDTAIRKRLDGATLKAVASDQD